MPTLEAALDHMRRRRAQALERYKALVAIPSISALPEHSSDVARTAQWLADELTRIGLRSVEVIRTPGQPMVVAERLGAPGKPTVLAYGHYDVQPVDPLDEWESNPFEPSVRGDNLYARGAADMKGSLWAFLVALEASMAQGELPINVRFLLEGEEEVGSPNMVEFIRQHRERLAADVVVNLDGGMLSPTQPAITYALRGLAYFEVEVRGPDHDLHSGVFGGSVHNPLQVLCESIAGMHDADGRITLPGFYDAVRLLDDEEREALARLPHDDAEWRAMAGVPKLWGEQGYTTLERLGARPSLDVNGIIGGFTGAGAKTVLPARAMAKVSVRLVADQDPAAIKDQLCAYMRKNAPDTVTWAVRELSRGPGAIMERHSPYMHAACDALEKVFGTEPLFKREGGSVPVVGMLQQELGVDSIMLGFCLPDSGLHGPNEKQHLPTLFKGIETYVRFIELSSRISSTNDEPDDNGSKDGPLS